MADSQLELTPALEAYLIALSWVWSSSAGYIVRGMQAVLLVWTDGRVKVPVGMRLWQKGGSRKSRSPKR